MHMLDFKINGTFAICAKSFTGWLSKQQQLIFVRSSWLAAQEIVSLSTVFSSLFFSRLMGFG